MLEQPARTLKTHQPVALALLAAAVAALSGCCCGSGAPASARWVDFQSDEGHFKARFPQAPEHSLSSDGREHRYTAQYAGGRRLLRASYEHDYNPGDTLEEGFRRLQETLGVPWSEPPASISLGEHSGLEAAYEMQEGDSRFVVRHRIYHAGGTSYQVMSVMALGEQAAADERRFFSSFELLPP